MDARGYRSLAHTHSTMHLDSSLRCCPGLAAFSHWHKYVALLDTLKRAAGGGADLLKLKLTGPEATCITAATA